MRGARAAAALAAAIRCQRDAMRPHAFVAMPFGTKPAPDGTPIDFNRVYEDLIRPALAAAGCEPFRADQEQRAGNIRADMFQELLVADLVVADLTLDNPNVWYELGVRHALRARGVVLIQGPRPSQPFDTYTDRKLVYGLTRKGALDPKRLRDDLRALTEMVKTTLQSSTRRKVSPVYQLLPHLEQPEWRRLLLADDSEFAEAQRTWDQRMEAARQRRLPGNVLLLAGEAPTRGLRLEACRAAGKALLKMRRFGLALEQFEAALDIDPRDFTCRERRTICLLHLDRLDEARDLARRMVAEAPGRAGAWALAGRVEERRWRLRWRHEGLAGARLRAAAAEEDSSLVEAIDAHRRAFAEDPRHFSSGVDALALMSLRRHLGGEVDPAQLERLAGGVQWACLAALERDARSHWARACYAQYCLLREPIDVVRREFRDALATADGDAFALDSLTQRVRLFRELDCRSEEAAAALAVLEAEAEQERETETPAPRRVLLFSGLAMDGPGRAPPRFPPEAEEAVARDLAAVLDELRVGQDDLALSQAAAGGALLFLEACQRRGARCEVLIPSAEPPFVESAVTASAGGEAWRRRYFAVKAGRRTRIRSMPDELGPAPPGVDATERCNSWLLGTALVWGPERVHVVCLCDAAGNDGTRCARHMREEVRRLTGQVSELRIRPDRGARAARTEPAERPVNRAP